MSDYEPPESLTVFLQDKGGGCQLDIETCEEDAEWIRGLFVNFEPSRVIGDGRSFGFFVSLRYGQVPADVRMVLSNDKRIQIVER